MVTDHSRELPNAQGPCRIQLTTASGPGLSQEVLVGGVDDRRESVKE